MKPDKSALTHIVRRLRVLCMAAAFATGAASAQDLTLEIADSPDPVPAGAEMVFTVTVTNTTASQIDGVAVHVQLPIGVAPVLTSGCLQDPEGTPVCDLGNLDAFEPAVFTITALVDPAARGVLFTQASVDADTEIFAPPDAVEPTGIDSRVDLELDFSSDPDTALLLPGQPLVYTARIRNNTLARATGVLFQMNRPPSLRYVSGELEPRGDCFATSTLVNCRPGIVEGGDSAVATVVFEADNPGLVLASALVLSENSELDPSDNQATLRNRVEAVADLAVTKTADRRLVREGGSLVYEMTVTNLGPSPSGNVTVTDTPPPGVLPGLIQPVQSCRIFPAVACEIENLAVGETVGFRLMADILPDTRGQIVNSVRAVGSALDPVMANNEATASVEVRLPGDLNGDGVVDILDVGPLIAEINDGDGQDAANAAGGSFPGDPFFDVDGDGRIDRRDVEALGRLILGKP